MLGEKNVLEIINGLEVVITGKSKGIKVNLRAVDMHKKRLSDSEAQAAFHTLCVEGIAATFWSAFENDTSMSAKMKMERAMAFIEIMGKNLVQTIIGRGPFEEKDFPDMAESLGSLRKMFIDDEDDDDDEDERISWRPEKNEKKNRKEKHGDDAKEAKSIIESKIKSKLKDDVSPKVIDKNRQDINDIIADLKKEDK